MARNPGTLPPFFNGNGPYCNPGILSFLIRFYTFPAVSVTSLARFRRCADNRLA
jgi:hypothetical protein